MDDVLVDSGKTVHIATFIAFTDDLSLPKFMNAFLCLPAPPRPNTTNRFKLVDASRTTLCNSPSPLKPSAWAELLNAYPGLLQIYLPMILCFGAQLGYKGPEALILSKNLASALVDTEIIDKKLADDLKSRKVEEVLNPNLPFISSPLGLIPKHDRGWRKIHHFSHPVGRSVNDHIPDGAGEMRYTWFQDVLRMVIRAGKNCVILKRDMRDAFRNVPVAPHQQWLLGFM